MQSALYCSKIYVSACAQNFTVYMMQPINCQIKYNKAGQNQHFCSSEDVMESFFRLCPFVQVSGKWRESQVADINDSVYSIQSPSQVLVFHSLCHECSTVKKWIISFSVRKFRQSVRWEVLSVFLKFSLPVLHDQMYLKQHSVSVDQRWSWVWIHKKFASEKIFLKRFVIFS